MTSRPAAIIAGVTSISLRRPVAESLGSESWYVKRTVPGGTGCPYGCGIVFKIAADGTETVLYRFTGGNDGAYPLGGLVEKAGNFYGTAFSGGGIGCGGSGCGTVFELGK